MSKVAMSVRASAPGGGPPEGVESRVSDSQGLSLSGQSSLPCSADKQIWQTCALLQGDWLHFFLLLYA